MKIGLYEIVEYVGNRSRPLKEGDAVFDAGFVIKCGLVGENKVSALCLQSSCLTATPHQIEIEWTENLKKCTCTCKAGQSGFCKHVVAVLIYINRHENLEPLSCTDVQQMWGKEKKTVREDTIISKVEEFCHLKRKYSWETTPEIEEQCLKEAVSYSSSTVLARVIAGPKKCKLLDPDARISAIPKQIERLFKHSENSTFLQNLHFDLTDLPGCCTKILTQLEETDAIATAMEKQNSETWTHERQLRITGTKCYTLFTAKANFEKVAENIFFPKPFFSLFTEHGKKYEIEALKHYSAKTNAEILNPGLVICKALPWLAFSPDGVVLKENQPCKILEIKCPYSGNMFPAETFLKSCPYIIEINRQPQLKKKHRYYGQVQLGMAILNVQKTDLILYSPFSKTYINIEVEFDSEFCSDLIQTITSKYFSILHNYYCKKVNKTT